MVLLSGYVNGIYHDSPLAIPPHPCHLLPMERLFAGPSHLTPQLLLRAYAMGIFPMAESRSARQVFWVDPQMRAILPMDGFHVPRRLAKTIRRNPFEIRCDSDFEQTMRWCGAPARKRRETWINDEIVRAYTQLHHLGYAHSVECWRDGRMVGGIYGVSLGAAFFGESMFSRATDASKVALVHLMARLRHGGFRLMDVQFVTSHLSQFGAVELPRATYLERLTEAITTDAEFYSELSPAAAAAALAGVLQSSTQTS
jgi:leucyl/phenylalanyl-tRNA---protein transferase